MSAGLDQATAATRTALPPRRVAGKYEAGSRRSAGDDRGLTSFPDCIQKRHVTLPTTLRSTSVGWI